MAEAGLSRAARNVVHPRLDALEAALVVHDECDILVARPPRRSPIKTPFLNVEV
jgi:hypothetical protein